MTRGPAESFGDLSTGLLQTQAPVSEDPRLMGAQICSQAGKWEPRAWSLDQECRKQRGCSVLLLGKESREAEVESV